jgi:hypothetical protein
MATSRNSVPKIVSALASRTFIKTIAPEKKVLATIRAASRKNGTNKLTLRDINREIRAYRREQSL